MSVQAVIDGIPVRTPVSTLEHSATAAAGVKRHGVGRIDGQGQDIRVAQTVAGGTPVGTPVPVLEHPATTAAGPIESPHSKKRGNAP